MVPNDGTITLSASLMLGVSGAVLGAHLGDGEKSQRNEAGGGGEVDWPVLINSPLFLHLTQELVPSPVDSQLHSASFPGSFVLYL